jgi:mannose-6-phosphate isomerase
MLHGFRPLEEIVALSDAVPELGLFTEDLRTALHEEGLTKSSRQTLLSNLYRKIMTMPQTEVDAILHPLLARLRRSPAPPKSDPAFWVLRAAEQFPLPEGGCDRGLISIFLLNLIHLDPGQGTFQPARTLHAYLEGVTVELMANSDNVLRGGLTPKHVDVPELMRVLQFDSTKPEIISAQAVSPVETVYPTPAEEFVLSRIQLGPRISYQGHEQQGPAILLITEGEATAVSERREFHLSHGEVLLAPYQADYEIRGGRSIAVLFKAAMPR